MAEQNNVSGENMSLTQSLADRAQDLSRSIDHWNNAILILVACTVFLALLAFIAKVVIVRKNKQLTTVRESLKGEQDMRAEKNLLELQEKVNPRHLTEEQEARMIKFLKSQPKGEITLSWFMDDKESIDFAEQLGDILRSVEWKVREGSMRATFGSPETGIILTRKELSAIPPHAEAVSKILADLGFPVSMEESRSFGKNDVDLFVAKKP